VGSILWPLGHWWANSERTHLIIKKREVIAPITTISVNGQGRDIFIIINLFFLRFFSIKNDISAKILVRH
jgi:hypothetical protein